jgi:sigma-B regulation protein RsbU (phosphoserine phosphatase)
VDDSQSASAGASTDSLRPDIASEEQTPTLTAKILIVDDEPDLELLIRQRFRREIREGALDFVFARHGEEALAVLNTTTDVELVLTDINMPVMDGLTLLLQVRERDKPPATVVVSAYGDMLNIRAAMNAGAADFLTKPIDFQDFEATVNKTLLQVRRQRAAEADRVRLVALEHDLRTAAEIQRSFLPVGEFNDRPEFALHAAMIPARAIGGDFYDYFLLGDGQLGLVIGDVSGKGVPAALFMAVTRTLLRAVALRGDSPGTCLEEVNRLLLRDAASNLFVTLFYAILDPKTGTLTYSNGGHNPPFVVRAGGQAELLPGRAFPLGMFSEASYHTGQALLRHGDVLFLYTDGVTEAMNAEGQLFSVERLREALKQSDRSTPASVVEDVLAAVRRFTADARQSDDLTALAARFTGLK